MSEKVVPITLLTGYLGAGKTTLINHVLNNQKGYKVAVIVNDIGEVNIDADLIGKGGIVQEEDSSLVPLQNGCICCTLKVDLMQQIVDIINTKKFDYILIEASGVCEPLPIAQTITVLSEQTEQYGLPKICRLDNVVTVVDSLRLRDEFNCGNNLVKENIEEEDIENLLIQQIEFCNKIILNKVDELSEDELNMVKAIVKKLQPKAEIIEANYSKVDVDKILDTNSFNFEEASMSAGWIEELNREDNEEEDVTPLIKLIFRDVNDKAISCEEVNLHQDGVEDINSPLDEDGVTYIESDHFKTGVPVEITFKGWKDEYKPVPFTIDKDEYEYLIQEKAPKT